MQLWKEGRKIGRKVGKSSVSHDRSKGKIGNRTVFILIYSGASNNYVAPSVVLNCYLKKKNLEVEGLK